MNGIKYDCFWSRGRVLLEDPPGELSLAQAAVSSLETNPATTIMEIGQVRPAFEPYQPIDHPITVWRYG